MWCKNQMRGKQNQKNSAKNFMKQEIIDKLPPDAQKEFLKLAMKLDEKTKQEKVHKDFLTFVKHVWPEFIEGPHHKKNCRKI
jgi:hypothetical protein